jgi:hypothetical protein
MTKLKVHRALEDKFVFKCTCIWNLSFLFEFLKNGFCISNFDTKLMHYGCASFKIFWILVIIIFKRVFTFPREGGLHLIFRRENHRHTLQNKRDNVLFSVQGGRNYTV